MDSPKLEVVSNGDNLHCLYAGISSRVFPSNTVTQGNSNIDLSGSEIEDCSSSWTFEENSFDYIHARWLYGSIPDWDALFKEAYKTLKPGGWIESHEPSPEIVSEDGTVTPDIALGQWGKIFFEGGKKLGRTFDIIGLELQKKALREAGFVDIQEKDLKVRLDANSLSPPPEPSGLTLYNSSVPYRKLAEGSRS